jgi:transposase
MSQPPDETGNDSHTSEPEEAEEAADEAGQGQPLRFEEAVALVDTVPGIDVRAAQDILAEIGIDMSRFPTADHLVSWGGRAPGNNQSGGKRFSGRMTKGNRPLSSILTQVSHAATPTKDTYLSALYHRIAARRGKKRAIAAVGHSILNSIWYMLTYREPYKDLGGDYFDQRKKDAKVNYYVRQLEKLTGGAVSIALQPVAA